MPSLTLVIIFAVAVANAAFSGRLPAVVPALYLAVSVAAFTVYAFDKSAARNDRWRTPERTLHLLSLLCGWPGAVMAQRLLHHKTKKRSFRITFWGTVIANCTALVCLSRFTGR